MRNEIVIASYAKINLSIDVGAVMENGMHPVDMIMKQLLFHDDVKIMYEENRDGQSGFDIKLKSNKPFLPTDQRNLAYRAAMLMIEYVNAHHDRYRDVAGGVSIFIDITKRIPVAAGLAGGSGNAAAVLHGLNTIWNLRLSLSELCDLGKELGSDIPFCLIGQARGNYMLPKKIRKDPMASSCARATGTGTELEVLKPFKRAVVIAKPPMGVSTKEVYQGIDSCEILERPDNDRLAVGLAEKNEKLILDNMINVLENYTLQACPEVAELKTFVSGIDSAQKVLMSGSGPTIFALFSTMEDAFDACDRIRKKGYEAYWTKMTR